jgi:hypothetical protein
MMNSSVSKMFLERKTFKYQITEKMYTVLLITVLIYTYYIHIMLVQDFVSLPVTIDM